MALDGNRLGDAIIAALDLRSVFSDSDQREDTRLAMRELGTAVANEVETYYVPPASGFTPAFAAVTTDTDTTTSSTLMDLFQSSHHPTYSPTYPVTATGISYSTSTGRFTVDEAGTYLAICDYLMIGSGSAGDVTMTVRRNGSIIHTRTVYVDTTGVRLVTVSALVTMTAGQYLEFNFDGINSVIAKAGSTVNITRVSG